ncbi:MAG: hypothetical protein AABX82_03030 [Nanoarchaeota archaeon]
MGAKDAETLYLQIKNKLKGQEGKIVAIDITSGDYFVGDNTLDAYEKAQKKYPTHEFLFKRVGFKTTYVVGNMKL